MSNPTASPKDTARTWLASAGKYVAYAIGFLTWLAGVITWGVWILGDRTEPAPPTPTPPPFFVTYEVLPSSDVPIYTGAAGVIRMVGDSVDPDLMAGDVDHYYPRHGRNDLVIALREDHRISRPRLIQFGEHSEITLDSRDVDKLTLLSHLQTHRVRATFFGRPVGPIRAAVFTTIKE